ncbi:MAG: O-antigen ligase family protein [Cetobacterium sp.]
MMDKIKEFTEKNLYMLFLSLYMFVVTVFPKANSTAWVLFILIPALVNIKKNGYKKTGFEWVILFFLIAIFISFIGTPLEYVKFGFKELEKPMKFLSLVILIPQMFSLKKDLIEKKLVYLFLGVVILYSIFVYFGSKGIFLNYDNKGNSYRLTGGYQISSYSGILMIINLYYLRTILCSKKYIEKVIFIISLILLVLTNSRGAWLGALSMYGLYIILEHRKNIFKISIVVVVLSGVLWNVNTPKIKFYKKRLISITDTKKDWSNRGRVDMWKKSIPIIKENPINGIGYRTGGREVVDFFNKKKIGIVHFHNMIIDIFAGAGILGVLSYLFIYLKSIKNIIKLKVVEGLEAYRFLYPLLGVFIYDNFEPLWIRGYAYNLLFALVGVLFTYNTFKGKD